MVNTHIHRIMRVNEGVSSLVFAHKLLLYNISCIVGCYPLGVVAEAEISYITLYSLLRFQNDIIYNIVNKKIQKSISQRLRYVLFVNNYVRLSNI